MTQEQRDSLELSIKLNLKGIFPRDYSFIDYSLAKKNLKKQVSQVFTVSDIDQIIRIFIIKTSQLTFDNQIISVYKNIRSLYGDMKPQVESIMNTIPSRSQIFKIIRIFLDLMTIFKTTQPSFSIKPENENIYVSKKIELNKLFLSKRQSELTKEELHFIDETWCYYHSIVVDIDNQDNRLKEQIKELNISLSTMINSLEIQIATTKQFISQIESFPRFLNVDIIRHKKNLAQDEDLLISLKSEKNRFKQSNSHELNSAKLKEQAYFAILFCAETLGLSPQEINKDGNPFLSFLEIMTGLNKIQGTGIKNRLSQVYRKYKNHKERNGIIGVNPMINDISVLRKKNTIFQSTLLSLKVKPSTYLINKDK